jgi:hypothetical protein
MLGGMNYLYDHGSWSMHDGAPVTGVILAIVWVSEACIVVGMCTFVGYSMVSRVPYCETSRCWLDQVKTINTLAPFTDSAQLTAFKSGDLGPLTQAKPKNPDSIEWTRITLRHSPNCPVFHTICLQNVSVSFDKNGKRKVKARDLTKDLILPAEMFPLIAKFEHFTSATKTPATGSKAPSAL